MKYTLDLPVDSPDKANAIEKTRQLTNAWVAKYRRDKAIIGRPSYGNAYSRSTPALRALQQLRHQVPAAAEAPKKIAPMDEFKTAEIALSRGR